MFVGASSFWDENVEILVVIETMRGYIQCDSVRMSGNVWGCL